jgi:hypothetical protein
VCIRLLPYSVWKSVLGEAVHLEHDSTLGPFQAIAERNTTLTEIAWVHARFERAARGVFTCLMIAISARGMLAARGVSSVLILGVRKKRQEKAIGDVSLGAHAWLVCCGTIVVGAEQQAGHAPVAAFRRRGDAVPDVRTV